METLSRLDYGGILKESASIEVHPRVLGEAVINVLFDKLRNEIPGLIILEFKIDVYCDANHDRLAQVINKKKFLGIIPIKDINSLLECDGKEIRIAENNYSKLLIEEAKKINEMTGGKLKISFGLVLD